MTAIILAAGVGKRLHVASGGRPKCLIEIGGKSLLRRLLESLAACGVRETVVVTGFGADSVRAAVASPPPGMTVRTVFNARYEEGAILSLATARDRLDRPVVVMDADVLCPTTMIRRLVESRHASCFLLDASSENTGEEQMLLVRDGWVRNIVRGGAPGYELSGESIGFLKLDGPTASLLRELIDARIAAGQTGIEHEEVYPDLLARAEVGFERVDGTPWTEIDFPEDVTRAEREILPRIEAGVSEPIRDAIVRTARDDAGRTVAGVPLLVRTALVLQKAGIERLLLEGPAEMPSDPRIRIAVRRAAAANGRHLVVGAGTVIDQLLVQAAASAGEAVCWERDGARIEVAPGSRPAMPPAAGTLLPASAPRGVVEHALLRALENPRDGYLDRLINRRLSRPLTCLLLRTPLTPNHVTIIGVVIGIAGGLLLGSPSTAGVIAGIAALLVSGVLDCCDGEIARIKFSESRIGHLLDITGDTLVHGALLGGIAMQLARTGAWPGTSTLVALGVGILGAFAAITWSEQTEARRHRVGPVWENRVLEGVLSPLTTRDWYVFPILFAVLGRLDALVPAAAWGAQVFWIAVAVLVWRVLRRLGS